jgi:hypothetical protein
MARGGRGDLGGRPGRLGGLAGGVSLSGTTTTAVAGKGAGSAQRGERQVAGWGWVRLPVPAGPLGGGQEWAAARPGVALRAAQPLPFQANTGLQGGQERHGNVRGRAAAVRLRGAAHGAWASAPPPLAVVALPQVRGRVSGTGRAWAQAQARWTAPAPAPAPAPALALAPALAPAPGQGLAPAAGAGGERSFQQVAAVRGEVAIPAIAVPRSLGPRSRRRPGRRSARGGTPTETAGTSRAVGGDATAAAGGTAWSSARSDHACAPWRHTSSTSAAARALCFIAAGIRSVAVVLRWQGGPRPAGRDGVQPAGQLGSGAAAPRGGPQCCDRLQAPRALRPLLPPPAPPVMRCCDGAPWAPPGAVQPQ